jgi:hypothetical protein
LTSNGSGLFSSSVTDSKHGVINMTSKGFEYEISGVAGNAK